MSPVILVSLLRLQVAMLAWRFRSPWWTMLGLGTVCEVWLAALLSGAIS